MAAAGGDDDLLGADGLHLHGRVHGVDPRERQRVGRQVVVRALPHAHIERRPTRCRSTDALAVSTRTQHTAHTPIGDRGEERERGGRPLFFAGAEVDDGLDAELLAEVGGGRPEVLDAQVRTARPRRASVDAPLAQKSVVQITL